MAAAEVWRCCILVTQTISVHMGQLLCFTLQLCTEWIKIFMHSMCCRRWKQPHMYSDKVLTGLTVKQQGSTLDRLRIYLASHIGENGPHGRHAEHRMQSQHACRCAKRHDVHAMLSTQTPTRLRNKCALQQRNTLPVHTSNLDNH